MYAVSLHLPIPLMQRLSQSSRKCLMNMWHPLAQNYNFTCFCMDVKLVLTLREEHKLRVRTGCWGPKTDEETGGWRKLHYEELHNLYSSPHIIRMVKSRRIGGICSTHGREERNIQNFGREAWREKPLGRSGHRWVDIKMDLRAMKIRFGVWIGFIWLKIWTSFGPLWTR
jgi:hypothetical protein